MKTGVDGQGPVKEPEEERSGVNPVRKTTLTNRFNLAEEYWESLFNRWSVSEAYVAGQQWRRDDANKRILADRPSNTQNFLAQYCQFIQGVISETQMDVKVEPASGKINLPPRPPSPAPAAQAEQGAEQAAAPQAEQSPAERIMLRYMQEQWDKLNIIRERQEIIAGVSQGLIRHVLNNSNFDAHLQRGVGHLVRGGGGCFLRVETIESENDFYDSDIRISITDPYSIYADPAILDADPECCEWLFERVLIDKEAYARKFNLKMNKQERESLPLSGRHNNDLINPMLREQARYSGVTSGGDDGGNSFATNVDKTEYWRYWVRIPEKAIIAEDDQGRVFWNDDLTPDERRSMRAFKEKTRTCVMVYDLDANKKWQPGKSRMRKWHGRYIPFTPLVGREAFENGRYVYKSIVEDSISAQLLVNYLHSEVARELGNSKGNLITLPNQSLRNADAEWEEPGPVDKGYLFFDTDSNSRFGPGLLDSSPNILPKIQVAQALEQNMHAVTGIQPEALGQPSNARSGAAIERRAEPSRQSNGEIFSRIRSAFARACLHILDAAPYHYDLDRIRHMNLMGSEILFMSPDSDMLVKSMRTGFAPEYSINIKARFGARDQNELTVASIEKLMQTAPQVSERVMDLFVEILNINGADKISERIRAGMPQEVLTEDERKKNQVWFPQASKPSPEQMLAQEEMEVKKLEIDAEKSKIAMELEIKRLEVRSKELDLERDAISSSIPEPVTPQQEATK